jgi:hypothetical protein
VLVGNEDGVGAGERFRLTPLTGIDDEHSASLLHANTGVGVLGGTHPGSAVEGCEMGSSTPSAAPVTRPDVIPRWLV